MIDLTEKKHKVLKRSLIEGDELSEFLPEILRYLIDNFYTVLAIKKDKNVIIKAFLS